MVIAISGLSGCGNTSVSKLISEKLNLRFINYTFRNLAKDKGIEFEEIIRLSKSTSDFDIELDRKIVELALDRGCVVGTRLAVWLLPDADLKVYLIANQDIRISRIAKREGRDFELTKKETLTRDESDTNRYKQLYNIDNTKYEDKVDLVVDTDNKSVEEIADLIINTLNKKLNK